MKTTAKFVTVAEVCEQFSICRNTVIRFAKKANALLKIGRAVRIDLDKLTVWLETNNIQ